MERSSSWRASSSANNYMFVLDTIEVANTDSERRGTCPELLIKNTLR